MKTCVCCKLSKSLSDFCGSRNRRDGLNVYCRECVAIKSRTHKERHPERVRMLRRGQSKKHAEKINEYGVKYRAENKEKVREQQRKYKRENAEKRSETCRKYRKANPGTINASTAQRHSGLLLRSVSWADKEKIKWFYDEAARLTRETGVEHQVDHLYPLRGEAVSGLHHQDNLQILTAKENQSKGNRLPVL